MALDTKPGTRGGSGPVPAGPVGRMIVKTMTAVHRRQGYAFQGMDLLILSTVGKKSGQVRKVPVAWFADGDEAWVIVASAAGSRDNPSWYYNIAAHPDQVEIELPGGRTLKVTPEQLEGDAREQVWDRITARLSRFADYEQKTDRQIPLIRLTPAA